MRRILYLPLVVLLALAPAARAGHLFSCCNAGIHCVVPPTECPDCSEPCPHGTHCWPRQSEHAHKLIDQLAHGECCCDRIKAAEKLGCCLHANFCCDPEVLDALVAALECDTCWEVRRAAAWSIAMQGPRTSYGVLALYLASKLDHHYLVRDRAREALDVLLVCRRDCFKDLFTSADEAARKLKAYYDPTNEQCVRLVAEGCGFTVHVCKKPAEEKKAEARPECVVPITVVEDGTCPRRCPAHPPAGPAPGDKLPPPAPEQLKKAPTPVGPAAK